MYCKGTLKLGSLDTSYCLIEVVTKAGLTVIDIIFLSPSDYLYLTDKYIKRFYIVHCTQM